MLSEVCKYLNNWFDSERLFGTFTIAGGALTGIEDHLQAGQYFRIVESVFNDGVYRHPAKLTDETFDGAVWVLKIPPEVIAISEEIDAWKTKYSSADVDPLAPYTSESFGGYSYSKGQTADGKNAAGDWTQMAAFTSRLDLWRKPRCRY